MMYRVMVTFDPMQCVATPLDSLTQQPRPSYERAWLPVTDDQAGDDGSLPTRGTQFLSERKINYSLLWNNTDTQTVLLNVSPTLLISGHYSLASSRDRNVT